MSAAWQEYVDCRESEFVAELAGLIDWGSAGYYPLRNVPLGTYNVTLPAVVNRNRVMLEENRPLPPDEPAVPCWEYDVSLTVPPTALLQPDGFQVWQDYNPEEHSLFVGYTVTTTSGSETNLNVSFDETYTYLAITLLTTVIGSESISTNWAGSILFTGYLDGIEVGTSTLTVTGTLDVIQYILPY